MDTGISMYHPDRGNVVDSASFVPGLTVEDFHGHGTHTSGTIAAADNNIGVVGVAPQADLLIAKVMDNNGSGQVSWLISGIDLEKAGHKVHWPPRDVDQNDPTGLRICSEQRCHYGSE